MIPSAIVPVVSVVISVNGNGYAVTDDDNSAKHSRCDGEAHEYTSLEVEVRVKSNIGSQYK